MRELGVVASAFGPLFLGLALHGLALRQRWWQSLQIPLDAGVTFRGKRLFGSNKTLRGVAFVALGTAIGYGLAAWLGLFSEVPWPRLAIGRWIALGAAVGAAAMLSELPNSFLKRQLNVAPGGTASGVAAVGLYVLDQVDFLLGGWLVLGPVIGVSWSRLLWSIAFVGVVHQAISLAGARLGMRASAR